jgi:endonuclease G, mitochondrial
VALQQQSARRSTASVPPTSTVHSSSSSSSTVDAVDLKEFFAPLGAAGTVSLPVSVKRLNENLVVVYDRRLRIPVAAIERHRKGDTVNHAIDRKDSKFFAPPDEEAPFQASNDDYMHSGFDRGHLAPASAFKGSQADMDSTFNLANVAPQVGVGFNRHFWARFEAAAKRLNKQFDDVYVITGTAILPSAPQPGERAAVQYPVLGGRVAVPTHFWKIVVAARPEQGQRSITTAAFLMPNAAIDEKTPLESFLVDQSVIEVATGMRFPALAGARPLCDDKSLCALPPPDWFLKDKEAAASALAPAAPSLSIKSKQ